MRVLILITLMIGFSSVSFAGGKAQLMKSILRKPEIISSTTPETTMRYTLAEELHDISQIDWQIFSPFKKTVSREVLIRPVGESKLTTMVGFFKPFTDVNSTSTKKYFINFDLKGYSRDEAVLFHELLGKEARIKSVVISKGEDIHEVKSLFLDGISNADQLTRRLDQISDAISKFGRMTDSKRTMIQEVSRMRKEAYGNSKGVN